MKVLVVSAGHPDLVAGDAPRVAQALFEGLRACAGVEAILLASVDRALPALFKPGAHITAFDGRPDEYLFLSHDVDPWWHRNGEPLLVEAFAEFLELVRPDVVHFHHFATLGLELLTLTRRVLPACRIVLTLHDFLAVCAADGRMVRLTDGALCDHASPVRCHQCFPAVPPEQFFLRTASTKAHLAAVDLFAVPSRFMREIVVRWGLPAEKLVHVPNAAPVPPGTGTAAAPRERRNRFGCFVQLEDAGGVQLLLQAVDLLRAEGFGTFDVAINADARRAGLEPFMAAEALRPHGERIVTFAGPCDRAQIAARMAGVDWCVVPSVWWQTSTLVVSEAWTFGRPVIAPDIGGPAERITHGRDGLLFGFADPRSLAETLRRAATEPGLWDRLAAGIVAPEPRAVMVERFLRLYAGSERLLRQEEGEQPGRP